jgi:hypothetical protein
MDRQGGVLAWQWSDYPSKHRDRTNLLLHIVAVPLFQVGTLALLYGIVARSPLAAVVGIAGLAVSIALEGRGHRLEAEAPVPFDGPRDFVRRFVAEQWVTFPRFVLSGGWYRNLRAATPGGRG